MKATRATAKTASGQPLPYGTVRPATRSTAKAAARRPARSFFSRVVRQVGAAVATTGTARAPSASPSETVMVVAGGQLTSSPLNTVPSNRGAARALEPGDVLRDLAFFSQAAEVSYFSTHPSLCVEVFGVAAGEVLERYGADVVAKATGTRAASSMSRSALAVVVVGARAGELWVWGDGDAAAHKLHVPAGAYASPEAVRAALLAYYTMRLWSVSDCPESAASTPPRVHTPESTPRDSTRSSAAHGAAAAAAAAAVAVAFQKMCDRAQEEALRLYTAEQQGFLQRAPDLYVAATKRGDWAASVTPTADGKRQQQPLSPSTPAGHAVPSPAADVSTSSRSLYAAVAQHAAYAGAVVLLVPRVMAATGTVGWVGEGDVVLSDALVGHGGYGAASLSASVVI